MGSGDESRRRQILDAAERLLRHYGPSKTTIAEIAREAAVGVGTVYLAFPSKEAILEELSALRHERLLRVMLDAQLAHRTYADRLRALLDARVRAFLAMRDEGAHACDLVVCGNAAVHRAHARFRDDERALVAQLLREGDLAGELCAPRPDVLAEVVLRAYASFTPPSVFGQPVDVIERELAVMHDLVLHGLLRRGARRDG